VLAKIKLFFNEQLSPADANSPEQTIQLAAAALMIELSRADFQQQPEEQAAIEAALNRKFTLNPGQLAELVQLAEQEAREATSLYQFTRLINDQYSPEQKFKLVIALWEVAFADGDISKYEDHLIRKVAELIYLPHSEFIRAKLVVQKQAIANN
jgi:uncharacterized tellurite resistance protein B-like protein